MFLFLGDILVHTWGDLKPYFGSLLTYFCAPNNRTRLEGVYETISISGWYFQAIVDVWLWELFKCTPRVVYTYISAPYQRVFLLQTSEHVWRGFVDWLKYLADILKEKPGWDIIDSRCLFVVAILVHTWGGLFQISGPYQPNFVLQTSEQVWMGSIDLLQYLAEILKEKPGWDRIDSRCLFVIAI